MLDSGATWTWPAVIPPRAPGTAISDLRPQVCLSSTKHSYFFIEASLDLSFPGTRRSSLFPLISTMPATTAETLSLVTRTVSVAPLVLLSVADHYGRTAKGTRKRVVGVLLGQNDGTNVRVSNSFAGV